MDKYTNEDMIKIQRELLTTPIEYREGVLIRHGVLKEEFPDVDFLDDDPNSTQYNTETPQKTGCCGLIVWIFIIGFIAWIIENVFM